MLYLLIFEFLTNSASAGQHVLIKQKTYLLSSTLKQGYDYNRTSI
jgi:hypothetical protein